MPIQGHVQYRHHWGSRLAGYVMIGTGGALSAAWWPNFWTFSVMLPLLLMFAGQGWFQMLAERRAAAFQHELEARLADRIAVAFAADYSDRGTKESRASVAAEVWKQAIDETMD